ncbi:MAG: peptide chain release factor N(5)-glutamine methyltransferase [Aquiluna sp.]
MQLKEAIEEVSSRLSAAGIVSHQTDAELIIAHSLGISRGELITSALAGKEVSAEGYEELVKRREAREPLQHITGKAPFRGFEVAVGPGVFVPRFETEQVVQLAIDFLRALPHPGRAVDVGSGSGIIAIALALETSAHVSAIESSPEALSWLRSNLEMLAPEVELLAEEFETALLRLKDLDVVISNPPYIPAAATPIDPEVQLYDPSAALYSGEDGLDAIREIVEIAPLALRSGGLLVLEHADGQSDAVCELLLDETWRAVSVHPDPTGRLRAVTAMRK